MDKYVNADKMLKEYEHGIYDTTDLAEMLYYMPAADVIEVRHGKWIPVDSYSAFGGDEATWIAHGNPVAFYYCSVCGEQTYAGEDGEPLITDYCPNCGAKMK